MDEMDLLRRHRPPTPALDAATLARIRAPLTAAQAAEVTPRQRWRRPLPALAGAAAVVVAVVVVVIGGGPATTGPTLRGAPLGPAPAAAAVVEAVRDDTTIELRFLEPAADEQRILDEIRAAGVNDLEVRFVAASPSAVWQLAGSEGADGVEYLPPGSAPGGVAAIRVPADYTGGMLVIGRPARPGEVYSTGPAGGAEMPGEELHCSGVSDRRVADAQQILAARGIAVEWRTVRNNVTLERLDPIAIADWYVDTTTPWAPGEVLVWVRETPPPAMPPAIAAAMLEGCDTGGTR